MPVKDCCAEARRQEFDTPRYLGVAGSGLQGRDGGVNVGEIDSSRAHRLCWVYLLSHEDQLKDFNQKSKMIRFSFYTVAL